MNNKIVFLCPYSYISRRNYQRFGLDYLTQHGHRVEVWCICDSISNEGTYATNSEIYEGPNRYKISSYKISEHIKKNRNAIYMFNMPLESKACLRALSQYRCKYYVIGNIGASPMNMEDNNERRNNLSYIIWKIIRYYNNLKDNFSTGFFYFKRHLPQVCFLGIDRGKENSKWISSIPSERVVHIHTYDYDNYLQYKMANENSKLQEAYIVYIDDGYGNEHEDSYLSYHAYDPWEENPEKMLKKLENVFDKLEKQYSLPIVVAAHPNVIYKKDILCGRKVIFNKTTELVANSKFVIMNVSRAISQVLLFKKNVMFFMDNDLKRHEQWNYYYMPMLEYFKVPILNMDDEKMMNEPWKYVHELDQNIVKQYIETYVKGPGTPEKLFIEVVEARILLEN